MYVLYMVMQKIFFNSKTVVRYSYSSS